VKSRWIFIICALQETITEGEEQIVVVSLRFGNFQ